MKIGLHTQLKPGAEERYEEYHRAVWPEVLEGMRRVGIAKYVIFRDGLELFHYIECDDYDRAIAELARSPLNQRWEAEMAPTEDHETQPPVPASVRSEAITSPRLRSVSRTRSGPMLSRIQGPPTSRAMRSASSAVANSRIRIR